ncbi:MAG: hypothetical protein PHX27_01085 [Candidatus ainarchaeum sp.]|nr:hypothetical protein [Candidatus ainarchaeum sp.]
MQNNKAQGTIKNFSKKFHQNNSAQGTIGNFLKKFHQKNNAQGTIEYLIIIAIIIVIGLIVAGISTNMFDIQQITQTNDQLKGQLGVGGISVIESITNTSNDTGLLNFKNNSGETITITKITTENGENKYNETIQQGNNELIQLTNTCECEPNQKTKTCEFQITYKTKHGLEKTITQKTIIQCEDNPEPTEDPILPDHCFKNENELIQICSLQDLNQIRDKLDGNYILMKDIDASETINWNGILGWEPIGNDPNAFTGSFNGNNKTINGIYVNRLSLSSIGFFGEIVNAEIINLKLTDLNITGNSFVGGLSGYSNNSTINNIFCSGTIKGKSNGVYTGGIIGYFQLSNLTKIHNTSNVIGGQYVGGISGKIENYSTINQSYNTGNIISNSQHIGGLAGYLNSNVSINDSYNTGNISFNSGLKQYYGGIAGTIVGSQIINCYNTGNITGLTNSAGITPLVSGPTGHVKNSYNTGKILGTNSPSGIIDMLLSNGKATNVWWFNQPDDNASVCGVTGCGTITQINEFFDQTHAVYTTNPTWDFENIWTSQENNYPILKWQIE